VSSSALHARAIAPRPGILFADEPTGNLDGRTGTEIMNLMFALQRERGTTLILVTHDEDLVRRCDRIVRLRDGRIDGIETVEHTSAPIPMSGPMQPVVIMAPIATTAAVSPRPEPTPAPTPEPIREPTPEPTAPDPPPAPVPEPAPAPVVEPEPPAPAKAAALVEPEPVFEPEPARAEPAPVVEESVAAAALEMKPDPELTPEQIESDLGVGVASTSPEFDLATSHTERVTEAIAIDQDDMIEIRDPETDDDVSPSDAPPPDADSIEREYRRVAAGGE
jgi:energy-coupling factor transporter ATP-binding protein EcfA2